ncbi:uncharacterized protein BXZ73DRAFT_39969 [Epithele typhae]|uniref:uncharacterized protein n=1 Tax=Epithele typhae TaxID=378194 RepID=UPI00200812A3|nr:uncharacterized protein BXZ73DRAFT_39969 [Epithele typhae]KAH9944348.1 hypothetical protein BXZ73DRAFT_39969 [Epithele typhae]
MSSQHHAAVHLGGKPAVALFTVALVAFVAETQLTQYVQTSLGFRHPYLIFYIVHSSFLLMFPLHALYLYATSQHTFEALRDSILDALLQHFSPKAEGITQGPSIFPTWRITRLVIFLTIGMSVPSLLWFVAVTMAPVTDVTALWNTNAFFAYIFTISFLKIQVDPHRLLGVVIATAGALAVIYGEADKTDAVSAQQASTTALIGDLMTLAASVGYGAYQVLYKVYAVLPNDPEVQAERRYSRLAPSAEDALMDDDEAAVMEESRALNDGIIRPLPFGLFPNLLTSLIGLCTCVLLWVPVPLLDAWGVVPFELPHGVRTYFTILCIAITGSIFNASFMVLLGVWGPIVTSVGNLLTIVLVFASDAVFGNAVETITVWSLLGCGSIVLAFGILAYDMMKGR